MRARILALAVFSLFFSGCVTPNYVKPTVGDVASLNVTTKTSESFNQQVRVFRDADCSDYPGQIVDLLMSKRVGIESRPSISTTLAAGQMATISVFAGVPRDDSFLEMFFKGVKETASENRMCEAFVSFVPKLGGEYQVTYNIDGSPCSINVMEIRDGQGITVTSASPSEACSMKSKQQPRIGQLMLTN